MWNRGREVINHCMNAVLFVLMLGVCIMYVGVNSLIMTAVINNLRMDTYVGVETGVGVVTLLILLGWAPLLLTRHWRRDP